VDLLIAKGADLASPGEAGQSALASAACRNRPLAVKALVRHGSDVNARDSFGASVVISACTGLCVDYGEPSLNRYEDRLAIIEYLVSNGANLDVQAVDGETALLIAAKYDVRFVELLLRLGANPRIRDKRGKLPIDVSREFGQEKATAILQAVSKR
jgi:ankyrin repeat protein